MNFPGDKSHGARTAWPRLWETWSHWICCEGWQEGNDQKDSESEGQLVQMSTDSLSYLAIQVTEKDIWIVTYPRSGTTWTQEMVGFLCLGLNSIIWHFIFPPRSGRFSMIWTLRAGARSTLTRSSSSLTWTGWAPRAWLKTSPPVSALWVAMQCCETKF